MYAMNKNALRIFRVEYLSASVYANLVRTQGTPDESLMLAFKATVMTAEDTFFFISDISYESSAQINWFPKTGTKS